MVAAGTTEKKFRKLYHAYDRCTGSDAEKKIEYRWAEPTKGRS